MAKIKTHLYDAASYLTSEEDCALYLQAVIDEFEGDPTMIVTA
jgi:DNA-binding phage protein